MSTFDHPAKCDCPECDNGGRLFEGVGSALLFLAVLAVIAFLAYKSLTFGGG